MDFQSQQVRSMLDKVNVDLVSHLINETHTNLYGYPPPITVTIFHTYIEYIDTTGNCIMNHMPCDTFFFKVSTITILYGSNILVTQKVI